MPRSPLATHWDLDPAVTFLNHGSFGAAPRVVLEAQQAFRTRLEAQPLRFMIRELEPLLDRSREVLAALIHADAEGIAFVNNATTAVNTALASLRLHPGDELVVTDHEYNACRNALDVTAARTGAKIVVATVPFPIRDAAEVTARITECFTTRTRLVLVDHVTSPTALVMPIAEIAAAANARGIDTLVDGAHGVGIVPLDLEALGVTYYTSNLHKWLCTPKGCAVLWVREDRRDGMRPLVISHGANSPRTDRSRFRLEFDWTGTDDPTPFLVIPTAIEFFERVVTGGLGATMRRNRELALEAREILCTTLGVEAPAPASMIAAMASIPLPPGSEPGIASGPVLIDPLQDALYAQGFEVPIVPFPQPPARLVRISAQLYNDVTEYRALANAIHALQR